MFFSPFRIAIASLWEEKASLSAFGTFVLFALVWLCLFPLPGVWVRLVIVALTGLFSQLFVDKNSLHCYDGKFKISAIAAILKTYFSLLLLKQKADCLET